MLCWLRKTMANHLGWDLDMEAMKVKSQASCENLSEMRRVRTGQRGLGWGTKGGGQTVPISWLSSDPSSAVLNSTALPGMGVSVLLLIQKSSISWGCSLRFPRFVTHPDILRQYFRKKTRLKFTLLSNSLSYAMKKNIVSKIMHNLIFVEVAWRNILAQDSKNNLNKCRRLKQSLSKE